MDSMDSIDSIDSIECPPGTRVVKGKGCELECFLCIPEFSWSKTIHHLDYDSKRKEVSVATAMYLDFAQIILREHTTQLYTARCSGHAQYLRDFKECTYVRFFSAKSLPVLKDDVPPTYRALYDRFYDRWLDRVFPPGHITKSKCDWTLRPPCPWPKLLDSDRIEELSLEPSKLPSWGNEPFNFREVVNAMRLAKLNRAAAQQTRPRWRI